MEGRFMLNEDCFLVKGAKRGAVYNLKKGDVYSIDEESCDLLELCESGKELTEVIKAPFFKDREGEIISYLENLENIELGQFLNGNGLVKKIEIKKPENKLDFIWLEITNKCNLKCRHCYNESSSNRKLKDEMHYNDWTTVMQDAYKIGCRSLQFIGGEPFLTDDLLIKLTREAREIGYEFLEIFTNGTLVQQKHINFLCDYEVAVALSVYGPNAEIHDQITLKSGSFEKTVQTIQSLKERGIQLRLATVIMIQNQDYLKEILSYFQKVLGIDQIRYDIVRPSGRGCNYDLFPKKLMDQHKRFNPKFPKCSLEKFQRMRYGHNCFSKNICVNSNGDVIPCIMERDIKLGNILEENLDTIIKNEKSRGIRMMSKDFVEVCKDCEYRYACFDCRPKAKGFHKNLYAKPSECLYNPYLGKWEGGK